MCLCNQSYLTGRPAILRANVLSPDSTCKVSNHVFIPPMLISIVDCCHFIPLLATLTLAVGHKISTKRNLLASCSCTFQLYGRRFGIMVNQFKLYTLRLYVLVRFIKSRITCCSTDCIKKTNKQTNNNNKKKQTNKQTNKLHVGVHPDSMNQFSSNMA